MKYIKIFIIFITILFISGCYDYIEINDLLIISGILIDYNDNKYDLTFQIVDNDKIQTYTNQCNNIDECIYKLSKVSNKEVFISHLKILLLTENTIKSNINYYDYFLRDTKIKMNFNVYYAENKDIIKNIDSTYIKELSNINSNMLSSSSNLQFLDLVQKVKENNPVVYPSLNIIDNNIILDNLVVFYNDKRIILDEKESIYYNILTNNTKKTILDFKCEDKTFSLVIDNINTSYKWNNNIFYIDINGKSNINYYNCKYDLDKKETIDKLSTIASINIKDNVNKIVNISKDNNDFIGINSYIYKHSKTKTNISDINTKIKVNIIINSLGELKNEL